METGRSRPSWNIAKLNSPFHTVILVCLVALLSYLAPKLAGALLLHPQTVWPLWPGCALLVPVLLLVPRKIWPIVIPAAFAAFVLYDLQAGVPVRSIAWFIPADTVEVLIAAFGLSYFSDRMPRLNSLKALGKYLFFVALLAPFTAAFLSAPGIRSDYWTGWKICFFSEVLALVTQTPAILGWVTDGPAWVRKSRAYHLEFAGLMTGLVLLSYITFTIPESSSSPALLYSLVPFLLWAALRFGSMGVSSSVVVVAFLSIWGAVHGRGPFTNGGLFSSVLSLQLFLVFAAIPFMVLAALVEERKRVEEVLRESEERLRLAMEVGKLGGWEWDIKSGRNPWFGEAHTLLGMTAATRSGSVQDFWDRVHPENLGQLRKAMETARQNHGEFDQEFRVVWPDGTLRWLRSQGRFFYAPDGEPERMLGISKDITKRKRAEEALRESENKLRLLLDSTAEAIYGIDLEGRCTFCNPACLRALGYERDDGLIGKNMHHLIHHTHTDGTLYPVEECRIFRALRTGEGVHVDDEVLWRANRTSFPAEYWSYPQRRGQEIVGAVVAFIDITERKVAEVALASVSRRLIEAQEQERTRIARELHDDIGQRLALLTIELEQLQQNSPDLPAEVRSRVGVLREQVSGVATDVQSLSHELHSSKLEYLGIATALRAFCEEFSDQQSVEVVFAHDEVPRTLPQGISLCLFRVLQEALHNAVKHSGARHFDVELRVTSNQIQLTVRDSGSGFDVAEAMKTHGLGLVSMAERLKLVDGQLSIDSQPQRGATICASIPLGKVARASV